MSNLAILIPAAGKSARMRGGDKCLETIAGVPALRRLAEAALTLGGPVVVVLPEGSPERLAALNGLGVQVVHPAGPDMSDSLKAGQAAVPGYDLMVVPVDMPKIGVEALRIIAQVFDTHGRARVVRGAGMGNKPGHPVVFPAALTARFGELSGDSGAAPLLAGEEVELVPLGGNAANLDLDTPEDWEAWRINEAKRP